MFVPSRQLKTRRDDRMRENHMLVNLKDITAIAEQNNMAVGAFNSPNLESVRAAIDTAEKLGLPVIIDHAEGHVSVTPLDVIGPVMVALAERSSAPVCVHLDHCEHLSYMRRALEMGFTGAMFDGSTLPYERNVELGHRAADMCHNYDCGLECELGSMGAREMGAGHENENDGEGPAIYTDPDQANDFIAATGTDILAVSFGTSHGLYKGEPHLSFDVLKEIRKRTLTPLVMHGGSGVSDEDYHKAMMPAFARSTTSPMAPSSLVSVSPRLSTICVLPVLFRTITTSRLRLTKSFARRSSTSWACLRTELARWHSTRAL